MGFTVRTSRLERLPAVAVIPIRIEYPAPPCVSTDSLVLARTSLQSRPRLPHRALIALRAGWRSRSCSAIERRRCLECGRPAMPASSPCLSRPLEGHRTLLSPCWYAPFSTPLPSRLASPAPSAASRIRWCRRLCRLRSGIGRRTPSRHRAFSARAKSRTTP